MMAKTLAYNSDGPSDRHVQGGGRIGRALFEMKGRTCYVVVDNERRRTGKDRRVDACLAAALQPSRMGERSIKKWLPTAEFIK